MQFGVTVALIPHSFESGYHLAARHSAVIEARLAEDVFQIGVATLAFEQETGNASMATAIVLCVLSRVVESAVGLCDLL